MTPFRYIPLPFALAAAGAQSACATSPMTPMNKPVAGGMAAPHAMARMNEQMKTMLTMEMMQAMMGMMHEHMMASMPTK